MTTTDVLSGRPPGRTTAWWGMVLLIFTEATLFAIFILSDLYLRFSATPSWPPPGIQAPTLRLPVLMTVVLVASSVPVQLAADAARAGCRVRCRMLLGGTIALGLTFLALQAVEYHEKLQHFSPRTNTYGSLFFTITGFHGLHVIVGILLLSWAVVAAGQLERRGGDAIENIVLYWHFVDAVWLVVFATLYLSVAL
jgi:heme/copper-type cytochrome/quinol oxidase subunit 3